VGFQIVLVTGDNHVAVPQNISAAVNYDCVNCLSYALATQLFVTLKGPLSDAGTQQIAALWQQIAEFGTHITEVPLSEIKDRLTAYEKQILDVIEKEQGPLTPDNPAATPSGDATAAAESSDGASPTAGATDAAGPSDAASPTAGSTGASGDSTSGGSTGGSSTSGDPSSAPSTDPAPSSGPSSSQPSATDVTPTADATPQAAASATP
jgi:putative peptide zinc metalloprotease protein